MSESVGAVRTGWCVALALLVLGPVMLSYAQTPDPATETATFKKCWEVPGSISGNPGIAADASLAYFVVDESKLVGTELTSGEVAWTAETGGTVTSELVVADGRIIFVAMPRSELSGSRSTIRAVSARTGLSVWNLELPAADKYYLSADSEGVLAVSGSGEIWMLDPVDGRIEWHANAAGEISAPPRRADGRLLLAVARRSVEEYALDTGERVAVAAAEGIPAFVGAGRNSSAVYSDERGNVHSIKMSGGKNWKFRVGGRVVYVRAVEDNVLLGSADNFVYFMNVQHGNLLWKRRLPGRVANGGVIGKDLAVFTVIGESSAFILSLDTGRVIDRLILSEGDAFLLTPVRANGSYVLAATVSGVSAFSAQCKNQKSGR